VDAANINLPPCQELFIREVIKLGKLVIGVHLDGRPISSNAADECLNAVLEAWSPAEYGAQAITDVLLGDYNPGGRLPVTVPYHAGQIPLYYNHPNNSAWHQGGSIGFADYVDLPHRPRYCFGYGLSFTQFQYDHLALSSSEIRPEEPLTITAEISNTGTVGGDEVVQLYISDRFASCTRPVQELAGFRRIHLEPGETKTVRFIINPSQFAFLDRNMQWKTEKGEYMIRLGASSEDIRLESSFSVTEDSRICGKSRSMAGKADEIE
jgi:beta-glucosidase